MNQTENYNLSQWAKTDRILMEDFNADNAKIDAALGGKLEVVKFLDVTETLTSAAEWRVPVDGNALGSYFAAFIEYLFPADQRPYHRLSLDGSGLSYFGEFYERVGCCYCFPLRNPQQPVNFLPAGGFRVPTHANDNPYAQMKALKIRPTDERYPLNGTYTCRIFVF